MDEKRFQEACNYFCEQSGYDSIDDFLNDYGYMIESIDDYFYESNPKQGMDDLYYDTIGARFRIKKHKKLMGFGADESPTNPDDDEEDLIDKVEHEFRIVQKENTSGNFVSDYFIIDLKDDSRVYIPKSLDALTDINIDDCEETLARVSVNSDKGLSVICSSFSGRIGEVASVPNEVIDLGKSDFGIYQIDAGTVVIDKNKPTLVFYPSSNEELSDTIKVENMHAEKIENIEIDGDDIISIRVNGQEVATIEVPKNAVDFKPSSSTRPISYEIIKVSGVDENGVYKNGLKIELDGELSEPLKVHLKDTGFKGGVTEYDYEISKSTEDILKNHASPMHTLEYSVTTPDGDNFFIPAFGGLENNNSDITSATVAIGTIKDKPLWPKLIRDTFEFEYVYNERGELATETFKNYYQTGHMVSKLEETEDGIYLTVVDVDKIEKISRGIINTPYHYLSLNEEPYNYRGAFTYEKQFTHFLNLSDTTIGIKIMYEKINSNYPIIVFNSEAYKNTYYAPLIGFYAGVLFDNFEEAAQAAQL